MLNFNNSGIITLQHKDIKNNILDTRTISSGKTNNYQLRIYVSQDAVNTNWQNKYYHFNVNVKMEEEL